MTSSVLKIVNLSVVVAGKTVLRGVSCELGRGQVVALLGENGSGKSSLGMALMGNKEYRISNIEQAQVTFDRRDLLKMSIDERARAGLMVAWQNPVTIPGVSVFNLCKTSYELSGGVIEGLVDFKRKLEQLAVEVGLTQEHIGRSVNEGFSGGERKRLELLQIKLLRPKLVILDEIDSGLDANGVRVVGEMIATMKAEGVSFVVITHNKRLLEMVTADQTWEMRKGILQGV